MDQQTLNDVPIYFAAEHESPRVPGWARHLNAHAASWSDVVGHSPPGGVLVLILNSVKDLLFGGLGNHLTEWLTRDAYPGHLVWLFRDKKQELSGLADTLNKFPYLCSASEFTWSSSRLEESVMEAVVKYAVQRNQQNCLTAARQPVVMYDHRDLQAVALQLQDVTVRLQRLAQQQSTAAQSSPDPLADVKEVMAATAILHASSGRLSATQTAEVFGLSVAKLGKVIERSRQSLTQTPDAESLQEALRPFERIARLRAVLHGEKFLAWLNRANQHLDGHTPIGLIKEGRAKIVADLAEDMLLGTPS